MRAKVKNIVLCLLVASTLTALAQAQKGAHSALVDSLIRELNTAQTDSLKSRLLVSIGNQIGPSDSLSALHKLDQAFSYAARSKDDFYIANVHTARARFYQIYRQLDTAKKYYHLAEMKLADRKDYESERLLLLIKQNSLNIQSIEQPKLALTNALNLIPLAEKLDDQVALGNIYNNIGIWFLNIAQYKKAIQYLKKSVTVEIRESKQHARFAYSYISLAAAYYRSGQIDEMLPHLEGAQKYLLKAKDRQEVWAWYYNYIGLYAYHNKQYKLAESYLLKGLPIAKKENDFLAQNNLLGTLVKVNQATGNYAKALQYAKINYKLETDSRSQDKNSLGTLEKLAEINEKLGYYKQAYESMRTYAHLADSLRENEENTSMIEIEEKFKASDKEKKILQLQHENEVKSFALQKNRLYTGLLTAVSLLLLTLVILYFQFNRHHKKQLNQHKQLHQLEMDKVGQKNKISLLSAMLNGQETERTRIARDLHDGLGGILSALKIELSGILVDHHDKTFVDPTLKRIDYAVDELRLISQNLMPETLIKYGLGEAFRSYCTRMRNKGVQLLCQIFHYKDELVEEKELILYRIMQELVTNAIKHADATTIFVQLLQSEGKVTLTVEDNGKGLDKNILNQSRTGNGLTNILSRIEYINGELDIHSTPANGTTFTIECSIAS